MSKFLNLIYSAFCFTLLTFYAITTLSQTVVEAERPLAKVFYIILDLDLPGGEDLSSERIVLRDAGVGAKSIVLRPKTRYRIWACSPELKQIAFNDFTSSESGYTTQIPNPFGEGSTAQVEFDGSGDNDGDGMGQLTEWIVGTDASKPDSDGDGVKDLIEIVEGTNPLDGHVTAQGIQASARTSGTAVDIFTIDDLAVVADSEAGITILDLELGRPPTRLATIDTAGNTVRIALSGGLIAAADEAGGLAIVDITNRMQPRLLHQVKLNSSVLSVTCAGGIAFVGTSSGTLYSVEMKSAAVLNRLNLGSSIRDVALSGDLLYAVTDHSLHAIEFLSGVLTLVGSTGSPYVSTPNSRLFVGGSTAYVVHGKGYNTISLQDPKHPFLITASNTAQFGWKQLAANGSGLGVAAVSPNFSFDGPHDVSLYDLKNPTQTDVFLSTVETPGVAHAVSIYNGLAYVADGEAGVQVIHYLPFDTKGQSPSVELMTSEIGSGVEEGKFFRLTANVKDDVQVRNVEFYVDGIRVVTDGNFPFEHRILVPSLTPEKPSFSVKAKATDTGGNSAWSQELSVSIKSDAAGPQVARVLPIANPEGILAGAIRVYFNEPLSIQTVGLENFMVTEPGMDQVFNTPDDTIVPASTVTYDNSAHSATLQLGNSLSNPLYQLTVRSGIQDVHGNEMNSEFRKVFVPGVGLRAEYFEGINFDRFVLNRVDPQVDFEWGLGSPHPSVRAEEFSVSWQGFVVPETSGTYQFFVTSDDGVRLWVNGRLIVDNWTDHSPTENSGSIELDAGKPYAIRMEFYERFVGALVRLEWSASNLPRQVIPSERLIPLHDKIAPYITGISQTQSPREVILHLDGMVTDDSAGLLANYSVSGGLEITRAVLHSSRRKITLHTTTQEEGKDYVVMVKGLTDLYGNTIQPSIDVRFKSRVFSRGFVRRDVYSDLDGVTVADLTSARKFPDSPDFTEYVSSLEGPVDSGERFGQKISGFILPPISGNYVFYICSDDQSSLYLSTDEEPSHAVQIASEPTWNGSRDWVTLARRNPLMPENKSQPIFLEANKRYYFEALMKEHGGGDNLGVAWQTPHGEVPILGSQPIPGTFLGAFADSEAATIDIHQQPLDTSILPGQTCSLSVKVSATSDDVFYQWQKDGIDIPGANTANYTTPPLREAESGTRYRCLVSVPGATVLSREAVISILVN